jgi:hypothetical protein
MSQQRSSSQETDTIRVALNRNDSGYKNKLHLFLDGVWGQGARGGNCSLPLCTYVEHRRLDKIEGCEL